MLSEMLACVVQGLDHEVEGQLREQGKPAFPRADFLGSLFMELELSNHWRGQFFTPYTLCGFMARVTFSPEDLREKVEEQGFVTVMEPACGAGAMIIAFASAMLEAGFNPQQHLHVTAIDVDQTAAYMAFIQLSLLGIPATVYVGNTLTGQMREVLHTPFHRRGLWDWKLRLRHMELMLERPSGEATRAEGGADALTGRAPGELTLDLPVSTPAPSPKASSVPPRARGDFRKPDVTLPSAMQADLFSTAA
jgi:N-6 DNA Methylase